MSVIAGTPTTVPNINATKIGNPVPMIVASGTTVLQGDLVCTNSSGFIVPYTDASGLLFAGVSKDSTTNAADNALAAAPANEYIDVYKSGEFPVYPVNTRTFVQANINSVQYANSNSQSSNVAGDTTNNVEVGRLVEIVSTTLGMLRIDGYC